LCRLRRHYRRLDNPRVALMVRAARAPRRSSPGAFERASVGKKGRMPRPFEQLRFEDLPERPRIAHRYYDADTDDIHVDSVPFGRVRVHVVSYGRRDAPPLLLVHGLMTSSYSWRYLFERLGDRYRLIAPDLPGGGRSQAVADRAHSVPALATFVGELQQALGIDGCLTVGNSLGGLICMRRALAEPSSFERLAVIHAPGIVQPRLVGLHVALRVPGVAAGLRHVVRRDPLRWAHKNVHYYDETLKSLEEAHEYGDPLASADGAASFTRDLADVFDPRHLRAFERELEHRRERGARFPVPLMLAYAREDPTVSPEVGEKLRALLPDAEFHWLADSSHFAQVDTPDVLTALLTTFLDDGDDLPAAGGAAVVGDPT
jgi:pimeloyl-ACP methyl ester carboxylesterase